MSIKKLEQKEICLKINGKQTVKLKNGFIEFKNYSRHMPVPFKIYADYACILKSVKSKGFYTEKYQDHIPCSFSYKLVCVDNKFSKPTVVYRGENAAYRFIKAILEEYDYCKKVIKKDFNKNLIWLKKKKIFNKVTHAGYVKLIEDEKVRYHCYIEGKYKITVM